jgi:peptidoglycan/xylan/chitin deacetylase (PgdA/CDA1 family)
VFAVLGFALGGSSDDEDSDVTPRRLAAPPALTIRPPKARPISDAEAIERAREVSPWLLRGGTKGRMIALTFDDGPGPITPALLAELRRLRAPATFFPIGSDAAANPDLARLIASRPFAVGTHTATHARLSELGQGGQSQQILGGRRLLGRVTGGPPRMMRPPYGAFDDRTLAILRAERTLMVLWTYSAYDWKRPDADYIARRVLRLARPGAIVLMHDGGGSTRVPTLQALPRIVRGLRRRGYRLVTVPRLLRDAPPERRPRRPRSPYPG